ncbi:MAG: hypothetical protein ACTSX6_01850 [Candidatus Heimdallarchaeaceae archaeon]
MRYLEVQEDGSLIETQELSLSDEKVVIVVDEDDKRMWLWKGAKCPIRKKFIGSRALSDLRKKEYGFAYIPQTCDQNDETSEFVSMLKKIGKTDLVPEAVVKRAEEIIERQSKINVFNEVEQQKSTVSSTASASSEEEEAAQLKNRPTQVPSSQLPSHMAKMGAPGNRPIPTILSALESDSLEIKKQETVVESKPSNLEKSLSILRDLGTPKGFYRDLIIIGTKVYTETYMGDFEELDEPPEGIFFSKSHVPRMICENGYVRAIEFLKPEEGAQLSEEDEKIAQDIEDLLAMFEIEVG